MTFLAACSGESKVLENAKPSLTSSLFEAVPELRKTVPAEAPPAPKPPGWVPSDADFVYPLPMDLGVRKDVGGNGYFLAPRKHGKHNGVDFLAPVGTDLFAICNGKAKSAMRGGYGRTV